MNFEQSLEFQKDLKRLSKKWRSLPNDIESAKQYISPLYMQMAPDVIVEEYRRNFFAGKNAAILHTDDGLEVIKMRLDVADLGRNDKIRIIFVAVKTKLTITFIELYAKNEKAREDARRFKKYIS